MSFLTPRWCRSYRLIVSSFAVALGLSQTEAATFSNRQTATFHGIECEFSPGQEKLAEHLADRFAQSNATVAPGGTEPENKPTADAPLSAADLRAHRDQYLGAVARLLHLTQATPSQAECFDAFVDNYSRLALLSAETSRAMATLRVVRRFTLWNRDELARRMKGGEKIAGFSYDPASDRGEMTYGLMLNLALQQAGKLAEDREKLKREYSLSFDQRNGVRTVRGKVAPTVDRTGSPASPQPADMPIDPAGVFPVVVPAEFAALPADELAARLWDQSGDNSITAMLAQLQQLRGAFPAVDPATAFLVLHETAEVGIGDNYFHGRDRRWFADGVANYVAWRVVRDLHGADAARQVYDRSEQLQRFASFAAKADLRRWPASENQSAQEQESPLNAARYAFATNAVFLMHERAGEDLLPRLFAEIAQTPADKVSMKTIEKAWTKLTGTKLNSVLADATKR